MATTKSVRRRFIIYSSRYIYVLPAIICLFAVVFFPIVRSIQISLYNYVLYRPTERYFIGFKNYFQLIHDPIFWLALKNTIIWVIGSVSLQFSIGLVGALILNEKFRWRGAFRSLILAPYVIPSVIIGIMWEWLYDPTFGAINDLLIEKLHLLPYRIGWLDDPRVALFSVIVTNVWRGVPLFIILLLAGLQAIPEELYEAAKIDGASIWRRFRHITVPLLKPVIVFSIIIRVIWTFNYADLIFVMTEGGPGNATQITATYLILQTYQLLNFGYASAISVTLLGIMLLFTILYMKSTKGLEIS